VAVNYVGKTAEISDITDLKNPLGTNGPLFQLLESCKLLGPSKSIGVKTCSSGCATTPGLTLLDLFLCFFGSHTYKPQKLHQTTQISPLYAKCKQVTTLQPHIIQNLQFHDSANFDCSFILLLTPPTNTQQG
jgi:hypothetical protein